MRGALIGILVLGFGVWFGGKYAVEFVEATDPKYYPLIAPMISGVGTLGSVFIAYLLLRFNYRNQVTPIRVELYKKQIDLLSKASNMVLILGNRFTSLASNPPEEKLAYAESQLKVTRYVMILLNFFRKNQLILPETILKDFLTFAELVVVNPSKEDAEKLNEELFKFLNSCRDLLGIEELTGGYLQLWRRNQERMPNRSS